MSYQLIRTSYEASGIYGTLLNDNGQLVATTLEYPYPSGDTFISKLPTGTYKCILNPIILIYGDPTQTYIITGIPKSVGMRFGVGSTPLDGSVLLGTERIGNQIINSQTAFNCFMDDLIPGVSLFYLTVS